jgi:hypothetical protein
MTGDTGDQDWRLDAELESGGSGLDAFLGRLRQGGVAHDVKAGMPDDVVVTHDGTRLFIYAFDRDTLGRAQTTLERVAAEDAVTMKSIRSSHWDRGIDEWRPVDASSSAEDTRRQNVIEEASTPERRTMVASAGKLIREQFEQTMTRYAEQQGVECTLVEHPHLLTTQVVFTVSGPRHKIDEFARALRAEGMATIRADGAVMASPL